MRLSGWADRQGISYRTAWRWVKVGKMPGRTGTWIVDEPATAVIGRVVVAYCRVSSADQRDDLDRQASRVADGAKAQGLAVAEVAKEIGSGLNGHRRKITRTLAAPTAAVIVVEHRDRPARFGVERLQAVSSAAGRRFVLLYPAVLDPAETTDDPVWDITEVLTSMCARLYGRWVGKIRAAARAVAEATGEDTA